MDSLSASWFLFDTNEFMARHTHIKLYFQSVWISILPQCGQLHFSPPLKLTNGYEFRFEAVLLDGPTTVGFMCGSRERGSNGSKRLHLENKQYYSMLAPPWFNISCPGNLCWDALHSKTRKSALTVGLHWYVQCVCLCVHVPKYVAAEQIESWSVLEVGDPSFGIRWRLIGANKD